MPFSKPWKGTMVGIYKITNLINGRKYIGQSRNIERRKKDHFAKWNIFHSTLFAEDIERYGKENFRFEMLEILPDDTSRKTLKEKELRYIHDQAPEYNTLGLPRSDETKARLSVANKGKKASPETRKKQSESLKKRHLTHPQTNAGHRKKVGTDERTFESVKECAAYYKTDAATLSKILKRGGTIRGHKVWKVV